MTTGSKKIVVLGASGMLGSMVARVAREQGHEVIALKRGDHGFDASCKGDAAWWTEIGRPDLLVNCAAITRLQEPTAQDLENLYRINSWFPRKLGELAAAKKVRLVHISTDAVFRGRADAYVETDAPDADDPYGISKALGELNTDWALNVRCSMVGPEIHPRGHLLNWFLAHSDADKVNGFTNHIWHGVTTLQLANFCVQLSDHHLFAGIRSRSYAVHFSPNAPISKYDLLRAINAQFGRNIGIVPVSASQPRTRVLHSIHEKLGLKSLTPMSEPLAELFKYISSQGRDQHRESNVYLRHAAGNDQTLVNSQQT